MIGFIIFLILVGGGFYYYKSSPMSDSSEIKRRYKNRSAEQKKVIRYFAVDGCLSKTMSDEEYEKTVKSFISNKDYRKIAIDKIGLDESELNEIEPVDFDNWTYENAYGKRGKDNKWRSSAYQISWLFFSSTQVYLYQNTIHFDKDDKKELTEEYFYKDITNFSTSSDTVETSYWDQKEKKYLLENIDTNRFSLTVPGDKFFCSLEPNEKTERAIQGMKAKLREKKS